MDTKRPRVVSLDAFRGATVLGMLVVNNVALGARTPEQLKHAAFGAWPTFTDMVFPWFLLCAGLSLPFSKRGSEKREEGFGLWMRKAAIRAIGLFAIGCALDSLNYGKLTIGMGVLQLIGAAGVVAAAAMALAPGRRVVLAAGLLAAYAVFLILVPHPGGAGAVTGEMNAVRHLNSLLMPYGLKGIPSIVPAGALVVLGSVVGGLLVEEGGRGRVAIVGAILAALGAGAHIGGLPMAKEIWTPPYVLFAGGLGAMTLAAASALFDHPRRSALAAPLVVFGANALFAYAFPIVLKFTLLRHGRDGAGRPLGESLLANARESFGAYAGGWVYTLGYVAAVGLVLAVMKWRGWIVKL